MGKILGINPSIGVVIRVQHTWYSADASVFLNGSDLFINDGAADTKCLRFMIKGVSLSLARDTS